MKESGVVLDWYHKPIHWHLPLGRSSVYLPDSSDLWTIFWNNRHTLGGFAHSHPGSGVPTASQEDITTFAAVELALGKRLFWWITSADVMVCYIWIGPDKHYYRRCKTPISMQYKYEWVSLLRKQSEFQNDTYTFEIL